MKLLLDTHALIWYLQADKRLHPSTIEQIDHPSNEAWISAVTAWEIAIKLKLGKLTLPVPFTDLFPRKLKEFEFNYLEIDIAHIQETLGLPLHHGDPFDRMLIAQARVEGMSLISCDVNAAAYGVAVIW